MSNEEQQAKEKDKDKTFTIIVNGRPRKVEEKELTYLQVVQLAYPGETPTEIIVFTITYTHRDNRDGTMVEGDQVKISNGMIFNVTRTDKS